jgi:hypothetical protein
MTGDIPPRVASFPPVVVVHPQGCPSSEFFLVIGRHLGVVALCHSFSVSVDACIHGESSFCIELLSVA